MEARACTVCGKSFRPTRLKTQHLCSKECRTEIKRKVTIVQSQEIVALFGAERAAVVAARYGLTPSRIRNIWHEARRRGEIIPFKAPPEVAAPTPERFKLSHILKSGMWAPRRFTEAPLLQDNEPLTDLGKTFADIGPCECMWQIGKDADGAPRFCAEPRYRADDYSTRRLTASYCAAHGERAIGKQAPPVTVNTVRYFKLLNGDFGDRADQVFLPFPVEFTEAA